MLVFGSPHSFFVFQVLCSSVALRANISWALRASSETLCWTVPSTSSADCCASIMPRPTAQMSHQVEGAGEVQQVPADVGKSTVEKVSKDEEKNAERGTGNRSRRRKPKARRLGETPSGGDACGARPSASGDVQSEEQGRGDVGQKQFTCQLCPKTFNGRSGLHHHMLVHGGIKRHECAVCKKTFTSASQLKTHILAHTGERPHQCGVCEASFVQAGHLRNHTLTHTGEKGHQ